VLAVLAREIGDRPTRIIDIGCGYAKLFRVLNEEFSIEYCGIELNEERVAVARERHGHHRNFRVIHDSATEALQHVQADQVDVVVALETLEHVPEHEVVRIVERIAELRPKRFICSVPVEIGPAIWVKNVGSFVTG
jgi:2-polyprenyl-3-methyl-5-hydroxy-6-metoxy-1,4-benzoquinol methylase